MKARINSISQPIDLFNEDNSQMLPEQYIIYGARVSSDNRVNSETAPKLLKYLIDSKHWSPFELISIGIEFEISRAIAQQMLRHRSFSFQEFSQRYAEVTEMEPVQLRYQAKKNRQSSTHEVTDQSIINSLNDHLHESHRFYKYMIDRGVAKECARMVLPLTTQTTIIMHGTLRSWIHFFDQRCSPHAQLEIQQLAYAAREEVTKYCPWTSEALGWNK